MVTGAGSGIGRAISQQLASQGARLALADRNPDALADVTDECRSLGARVHPAVVDVRDRVMMTNYADSVATELGAVDLVFCVAGVIASGSVLASDPGDIEYVVTTNVLGTINTTKAFLSHVLSHERQGHVVLVSSAFGLMAVPNYAAYSASKFAIRGFADALRQEAAIAGHRLRVTCVFPGGVRTPIVRNGRFAAGQDVDGTIDAFERRIARTDPEVAAQVILRGVERRRSRVLIGSDARLAAVLTRAIPNAYPTLLPWIARRAGLMREPSPSLTAKGK